MDDTFDDADGAVFGDESAPVGANAPLNFVLGAGTGPATRFTLAGDTLDAPGFALVAAVVAAINENLNEFVQWQLAGANLGAPDVRVVNFLDPDGVLQVTRGVGDHSNVVTVRLNRTFSYYTSILYPFLFDDTLAVPMPGMNSGALYSIALDTLGIGSVPALLSGTLVGSINFVNYTNQRDVLPDTLAVGAVPTLQSGTLVVTINFLDYLNQRDVLPDTLGVPVATLQSGTLIVTINFIDYTNQRDIVPDSLQVASVPVLLSGTLV